MSGDSLKEKLRSEINASLSKCSRTPDDLSADIVDKLFKEFLNERIKNISSGSSYSLEQINALLDSEITHGSNSVARSDDTSPGREKGASEESREVDVKSKHKSSKRNRTSSVDRDDESEKCRNWSHSLEKNKSVCSVVSVRNKEESLVDGKECRAEDQATSADVAFDATTVTSEAKKVMNMSLKISSSSAEFISSGKVIKHRKRKKNLEDGEVSSLSRTSSDNSGGDESNASDVDTTQDTERDNKTKKHKRSKNKRKKKSKHKSHDRSKRSRRSRSHSKTRSRGKRRSRTRSRDRHHSRRSRSSSKDKKRSRKSLSRSRDWDSRADERPFRVMLPKRQDRKKSRSPKKNDLRIKIDKAKLREKAIARTMNMIKTGQAPGSVSSAEVTKLVSGGKSVNELTDYCKRISAKGAQEEGQDDLSVSSDSDSLESGKDKGMDFDRLCYRFKTEPASIVMNIRNSKQLPALSAQQKAAAVGTLRLQFPVSSGSQHRAKEWVPVEPTSAPPTRATETRTNAPPTVTPGAGPAVTSVVTTAASLASVPDDKVFPDAPQTACDISSLVSQRLHAVRQLQKNPNDVQAMTQMSHIQQQASQWAQSKNLPGQFMGSTGANIMSQQEIMGPKKFQAWAKKDQLSNAAPLRGGIGMFLLQKMGWKSGEGLGKNNEGTLTPLALEFKIDRKGLTSQDEMGKGGKKWTPGAPRNPNQAPRTMDMSGKHPVSALMEICNRRRWGPPQFTTVEESGPPHKRNFIFKVRVNNIEYQPAVSSTNKKVAKSAAATVCLQELGMLPR